MANAIDHLGARLSWGHRSPRPIPFIIQLAGHDLTIEAIRTEGFERGDRWQGNAGQTRAGGGDVDGIAFGLLFPRREATARTNLHSIWRYLIQNSDPDTARRLQLDPGCRLDARKLTVTLDQDGTRGFSVTVDQMLTNRVFWVPEFDLFLSVGEPPVSFADHQRSLEPWHGRRVLDQVRRDPEASYEEFTARWEDMGNPAYSNPASVGPGHIICTGWDGSRYKFGIDRGAGVWNDYGRLDLFRFWFGFGELRRAGGATWRGQHLEHGLPVITTIFEQDGVRYEVEQFAYPLHAPPAERRGDIPMVLLQKVRLRDLAGQTRPVPVRLTHHRQLSGAPSTSVAMTTNGTALLLEETAARRTLLSVQGPGVALQSDLAQGAGTNLVSITVNLPANGSAEFVVKLPSPVVPSADRDRLLALDYAACRAATLEFWTNWLSRGAQFTVPEEAVNDLFRANLWHALRLPRRHGGPGAGTRIDLPYSNFAYDQTGTPWPVNQAIYVDYMLYDLRGYHEVAAEELAVMFRNNQEPNGHIGGFANWGVYTPSMIYAVAKHYLLSGDQAALGALLPPTLRALDWCLAEMRRMEAGAGPTRGLILAPLNDLSHDQRAWAFNQAYALGGLELLARVLADLHHPRAEGCRTAAQAMSRAIERGFSHASTLAPLVQLRDHTWIPYVPCDALTPRRLMEIWYPTDVDTGALHLSRLKALDPSGPLTTALLHDHEDNLFLHRWGLANEPVYNQHATAYLLRDEPKPAIRAFYSMMACAFSHSALEPVEHRWGWGQYFGPPSTDGAWFELYRHMLIHERDDDTLLLLQATPRKWLEDGKRIRLERAPTYYGPLDLALESRVAAGRIAASFTLAERKHPEAVLLRLRHPQGRPLRSVSVNGKAWSDFSPANEWVRIPHPREVRYDVVARY